jgi:hypothetical protein
MIWGRSYIVDFIDLKGKNKNKQVVDLRKMARLEDLL